MKETTHTESSLSHHRRDSQITVTEKGQGDAADEFCCRHSLLFDFLSLLFFFFLFVSLFPLNHDALSGIFTSNIPVFVS